VDHRRRAPGPVALPDDPQHPREESRGNDRGLLGQLRRDGRCRDRAAADGREGGVGLPARAHAHPHEGGDAQPPDRDRAASGRGHGRRAARFATRAPQARARGPRRGSRGSRSRTSISPARGSHGKAITASRGASLPPSAS
jgi:hypothetical protein